MMVGLGVVSQVLTLLVMLRAPRGPKPLAA
jgi:hypothetical protein